MIFPSPHGEVPICRQFVPRYGLDADSLKQYMDMDLERDSMRDLTRKDWQALALLKAIDKPAGTDLLVALVPLSPSELQEFLRTGLDAGLVTSNARNITLVNYLPVDLSRQLARINTKEHLGGLIDAMRKLELQESLSENVRVSLYTRAGREYEAALLAEEAAARATRANSKPEALAFLESALKLSSPNTDSHEWARLFLRAVNEICRLRINLIRDIHAIPALLEQSYPVCRAPGDLRRTPAATSSWNSTNT
jgi:hypothetical protein